jgi:hypothetical protein
MSKADYAVLVKGAEEARLKAEKAREAVHTHQKDHRC